MMSYLCISVTFLDQFFHGKGDENIPEWPPSPMRLFQALLASSCTCGRKLTEEEKKAFKWLEEREPPLIIAPDAKIANKYKLFVPNNDGDKIFERQGRLSEKVVQPHYLHEEYTTIYYLWKIDRSELESESVQSNVEILCEKACHLQALGWGIDIVVGNGKIICTDDEVRSLKGIRWYPHGDIPYPNTLRVPKKGLLEELEELHKMATQSLKNGWVQCPPQARRPEKFLMCAYIKETKFPLRYYAAFKFPEGYSFSQIDVAKVAAMVRSLTCKEAKRDNRSFPGGSEVYVAGHVNKEDICIPRFSYLPLPSIRQGQEPVDGRIRRVLIAEHPGGDGSHAMWAQRRLRGMMLTDENGKEQTRLLEVGSRTDSVINLYVGEYRSWCSVTPVILPGYDDHGKIQNSVEEKLSKAERLLLKCFCHAGIPVEAVESVTLRKAPFWSGSLHPTQYFRPDYLRNISQRPGWHVFIKFKEKVSGPIALGAGRHCGLGIFAGIKE